MLITTKLLTVWSVWQMRRSPLGFQLKTQPCKNCDMCTAPYGYCNFWSGGVTFWCSPSALHPCQTRHIPRDDTLGSSCVQGPWPWPGKTGTRLFNFVAVLCFLNYLEGRTKWSRGAGRIRPGGLRFPTPGLNGYLLSLQWQQKRSRSTTRVIYLRVFSWIPAKQTWL